MEKSFSRRVQVLGFSFLCLMFFGCENFLNSDNLRDKLEKEVAYAKTPDVSVSVMCNNSYGTILSSTSITRKLGEKDIELSFTEAEAYQFVKWQVHDSNGNAIGCSNGDALFIKEPDKMNTTFSILKEESGYYITAECEPRPAVSLASPQFQSSGVNRDRAIIVTFNTNISKTNFRYTQEEESLTESGVQLLKDSEGLAYGYIKGGAVYYKNIRIRNANDSSENLLGFFGVPEVSAGKLSISPAKGAGNQFELDDNGYKDIEVTLGSSINNDGIKLRSDYVWTYRACNATDEQTSVSFSADSKYGELTPSGKSNYNVGSEIKVKFAESEAFEFIDWEIVSEDGQPVYAAATGCNHDRKSGTGEAVITVLEGNGILTVRPVCAPRPVVESFAPSYVAAGTNFDANIVLTFGAEVSKESFVYSQAEFAAFGSAATAVRLNPEDDASDIVAVDVAGKRFFKNLTITDENNENAAIHYRKSELSEDGRELTVYFDGTRLFDFDGKSTKDIYVTVSPEVYSVHTKADGMAEKVRLNDKGKAQDFNFRVRNASEAKAKVNFSVYDGSTSMGTMNYSGTREFNLGETFTVNFESNAAYDFTKWIVSGNEDGNIVVSENGTHLTCTVAGGCEGITIVPFCEKLNPSTIFFEATSGSVSPSGYVDFRRKAKIPLVSTISSDYCFTKWKVRNTVTKEIFSDEKAAQYFKFDNPYAAVTNVTVLQDSANLSIVATAEAKPRVYASTPNGLSNQVDRDSNIRVFMNKGLSEKSLYYTQEEAEKFAADNTILCERTYTNDEGKTIYVKPYGYYSSENDLSSYVFKNIKITDNSDGTNYLKYYGCPYLGDSIGKVLVIPVNKVMKAAGNAVDDTEGKNLPGNREILVEIGTEFGFYSDDVLVNLENVNLTWAYKTNGNFDTSKPVLTSNSTSISGMNMSGSCTYESGGTIPTSLASDIEWYKDRLVKKSADGSIPVTLKVTATDSGTNLQSVTLVAEKVVDSSYNKISNGKTSKYTLPIAISGQNGTFNGTINLIDKNTLGLDEGLYKVYFELLDQVGNRTLTDTDESSLHYYYLLIDTTPPKDPRNLRFFYRNGKVKVQNLNSKFNMNGDVDYASHSITVDGESKTCSDDESFTGLPNGQNVPMVITVSDIFGNSTDYTYQLNAGLKEGMALYTNGLFSDQVYDDLTADSVILNHNYLDDSFLLVKVRTDRTSSYDYRNNYKNENFEGVSFSIATQYQMYIIRNNVSLLQKFGAEDRTSYGPDESVSRKTQAYEAIRMNQKYDGIFYFFQDGGNQYYRGLYDLRTGNTYVPNGTYWYSVVSGTVYNMKAVLTFTDNE